MIRIVAFVFQLAVAVLLTAAGLYFDYKGLAAFGVALFALALVLGLWLVIAGKSEAHSSSAGPAKANDIGPAPQGLDEKQRAVWAMRRAVNEARAATRLFSGSDPSVAFSRLRAAYGPIAGHYNLPEVTFEAMTVRSVLKGFVGYIDSFLPFLEDGQVGAARNAALTYMQWHSD